MVLAEGTASKGGTFAHIGYDYKKGGNKGKTTGFLKPPLK